MDQKKRPQPAEWARAAREKGDRCHARFERDWQTFLKQLWDQAGGRAGTPVATEAVIARPGFDQATATRVVDYLVAKGLSPAICVALTAEGIDKLQALKLI